LPTQEDRRNLSGGLGFFPIPLSNGFTSRPCPTIDGTSL
jgi:hypothetical protein